MRATGISPQAGGAPSFGAGPLRSRLAQRVERHNASIQADGLAAGILPPDLLV